MEKGYINSFQSMGTLDGPGIRFVAFLQGCNLRCGCCHNPETWETGKGEEYTAAEIVERAKRFKNYFGKEGGITLSGGEPLLQPKFVSEIFTLSKENGINTCLDTSGSLLNAEILNLLNVTDRVLLDIKYSTEEDYIKYVGCSLDKPLNFLKSLNEKGIPTVLRQVIIPSLNDTFQNIEFLNSLKAQFECVEKIELLPFKKICQTKYNSLNLKFAFENLETPTAILMETLNSKLA